MGARIESLFSPRDVVGGDPSLLLDIFEVLAGGAPKAPHAVLAVLGHTPDDPGQLAAPLLGELREGQPDDASVVARRQSQLGVLDRPVDGVDVAGIVRRDEQLSGFGDRETRQLLQCHGHTVGVHGEMLE